MTRRGDDSTPDERSIELTLDLFNEHDTDALAKIVEAEDTLPKGYFSELSWAVSSNERASAAGSLEEQRRLRREALQPYIEWNRDAFSNGWLMSWAIRLSGVLIGNVQLWPTENPSEFEMGFWITSTHKRKGYMSRVANWIADVAFSHLEANRVIITTTDTNTQVLEFARALGFSDEGIDDDHLQCGLRPKQITSVRKFSKSNPLREELDDRAVMIHGEALACLEYALQSHFVATDTFATALPVASHPLINQMLASAADLVANLPGALKFRDDRVEGTELQRRGILAFREISDHVVAAMECTEFAKFASLLSKPRRGTNEQQRRVVACAGEYLSTLRQEAPVMTIGSLGNWREYLEISPAAAVSLTAALSARKLG